MKELFNNNWKFTKQPIGTELDVIDSSNINWETIDIPHDWLIYDAKNLYETSEGWYRKKIIIKKQKNKRYSICFDGVYMDSTVFVNNQKVGDWKYGYSSFEFDITNYLTNGANEIKVRVIYQHPNSRWYSGAGIYRNVWWKTTDQVHFVTDGIYFTAKKNNQGWTAEIEAEYKSESGEYNNAFIRHTIINMRGVNVGICEQKVKVSNERRTNLQTIYIEQPVLWELECPFLYKLKSELICGDRVLDTVEQSIGFRSLRFDCNEGFFLNDKHVKLHGACLHHDLGALGAAVNKVALKRQLLLLKEMGVNAIRTTHNMPSRELMELADEMGILIVSEAFDMWERSKTKFDYARFFNEWCEIDVKSWVRRDRNHPSIIMWSIGNEIYDTHVGERGLELTRILRDIVQKNDPKQNAYVTIGSNFLRWENAQKCAEQVPVVGYNYGEFLYEEHHKKYPHWVIYGSETGSTLKSRGIYHFPASEVVVSYEDEQCSSLDNCCTGWGADNIPANIIDDRDAKFSLGQFIWSGFDYIGEPSPYTTKNSYFGLIDTAGFKKDAFYLYQAEWTDYKTNPMIHLLPYWDFNDGQLIDIQVYSNAPKIELFFNDESLGIVEIDHLHGTELVGKWQLPYQKGTLKVVAYDEKGSVIATEEQSSFGDVARLVMKADKMTMIANGQDMIFVEISAEDENGVAVANANNRVEVKVSGAGRLVGLDNGDSTDYDSYKGTSRRLFSGKLLAMIAAKEEAGIITVKVTSEGLDPQEMILDSIQGVRQKGISAIVENTESEAVREIPIRKIELCNLSTNNLNHDNMSTQVQAKLYPSNTTYHDLEWKAVTDNNIITDIVKIKVERDTARLTAVCDGSFRLRCTAKNGRNKTEIISELEFQITGVGKMLFNPYKLVSAGLHNWSNKKIHSGLQGGLCTDHGLNYIGFRDVDFGETGSDEITIPIFHLSNNPTPIKVWRGIPGEEDSELLLASYYQKDYIYNVYIPQTYRLSKRLQGIQTICIETIDKLDIQGFYFTDYDKIYGRMSIKDNSRIYGDAFTITENAIEEIGNNVTIEFDNMNFGAEGVRKLIICGRSRNDINTIHVHFKRTDSYDYQILEVPYSSEYEEYEFDLSNISGMNQISFTFLPGSSFDFKWFQFKK